LNQKGQLGYANLDAWGDNENPTMYEGVALGTNPDSTPVSATLIAAGHFHTCALLSNHRLVCWGANESGQLGLGYASSAPADFVGGTPDTVPEKLPSVKAVRAQAD
jgi:alpha-tubulin suppressor-like RCC1 family protein